MFTFCVILTDEMKQRALFVKLYIYVRLLYVAMTLGLTQPLTGYTTFRRDRQTRGGGMFICVKNYIICAELWIDEVYET